MNPSTLLFQLMLAFLFTHELDAMTQLEWRLLYVLRSLSEEQGRWWFVAIHVPLFWGLIYLTHHKNQKVQHFSRLGVAVFCIVHALLHFRLSSDPLSTFASPLSWRLIVGTAILAAVYLLYARKNLAPKQTN
jgi:hypothetical protein